MLKRHVAGRIDPVGAAPLRESLEFLIISRIHAGSLRPGDRLSSIRDFAHRSGVDHRAVADAYRALENDGLVEVRSRAGVFVRSTFNSLAGRAADSWTADILFDAWEKGISRSALCRRFGGVLASPVRCGCIESDEDHLIALTGAIEDGLCLEAVPIRVRRDVDGTTNLLEELDDVDVIVTSVFHARYARALAAAENKPVAILSLRREFALAIATRCATRPVTAVMVDPGFAARSRELSTVIGDSFPARFVTLEEAVREKLDFAREDLLITRAARRRLDLTDYHLVPSPPMVSPDSARGLCEVVAAATPARQPRLRMDTPAGRFSRPIPSSAKGDPDSPRQGPEETGAADALSAEAIARLTERALSEEGLHAALKVLNRTTPYRFTGVYRFETDWVRSVALYDRENPHLLVGADVPMKESYCMLTAAAETFQVENALADIRLTKHKARDAVLCYCAIHLQDPAGASWGTICHYDFRPREVQQRAVAVLQAIRPALQRVLGPATPHLPARDCEEVARAIRRTASRPQRHEPSALFDLGSPRR